MTRAVDFALDNDTVTAVMTMDKESQEKCNEEEDAVPKLGLVMR